MSQLIKSAYPETIRVYHSGRRAISFVDVRSKVKIKPAKARMKHTTLTEKISPEKPENERRVDIVFVPSTGIRTESKSATIRAKRRYFSLSCSRESDFITVARIKLAGAKSLAIKTIRVTKKQKEEGSFRKWRAGIKSLKDSSEQASKNPVKKKISTDFVFSKLKITKQLQTTEYTESNNIEEKSAHW